MNRAKQAAHRRNARLVAAALPPRLRDAARSDRYQGRSTDPPNNLTSSERTRFSAAVAAWDMSRGRGRRVADPRAVNLETHQFLTASPDTHPAIARRAVVLLHQVVPIHDDVTERARIVEELEPVSPAESTLWPLLCHVAAHLAGQTVTNGSVRPTSEMLAADHRYGPMLDHLLERHHPLSVLATVHTWVGPTDRRRFEDTTRILDRCFAHYRLEVDPWTATTAVWDGLYVDTLGMLSIELEAHQAMVGLTGRAAQTRWREVVQPLARANAALRGLQSLGAEVDELMFLPAEPRPEFAGLRPSSDLFDTDTLRCLILSGLEVLDDDLERWAWRNMWSRGCRPQACLPRPDELLPFEHGTWRVLVPAKHSKTGLVVDYVSEPIAELVGWSPEACPSFVRGRDVEGGVDPTSIAESACRRVRDRWAALQAHDPALPDIPDRLAYFVRKLLALWLAQRVPTEVLRRWLSHTTDVTNYPYSRSTIDQVARVRDTQRSLRS